MTFGMCDLSMKLTREARAHPCGYARPLRKRLTPGPQADALSYARKENVTQVRPGLSAFWCKRNFLLGVRNPIALRHEPKISHARSILDEQAFSRAEAHTAIWRIAIFRHCSPILSSQLRSHAPKAPRLPVSASSFELKAKAATEYRGLRARSRSVA
jgi:hypothetical protein